MERVVVGMSGGVDSAVCAYLLKMQGYDVYGVTLRTWVGDSGEESRCCEINDARAIADALDIPYYVHDCQAEFKSCVTDPFITDYVRGITPNPCIECNRYVKWEALLQRALSIGADYIATGHYARISKLPNGRYAVRNSVTATRDQNYALYNLTQDQLAKTLMPVGEYTKEEIRTLAEKYALPVANKPDSQDICFVPDGDYGAFLQKNVPDRMPGPGNFVTTEGKVVGQHKGIIYYTVGQRKGLGLSMGKPVFVSEIRPENNEVVIAEDEAAIFKDTLDCHKLNFMGLSDVKEPVRVRAKVRYAHPGEWCTLERIEEDRIRCHFDKPVRAVTPGQAVVFYDGEYVMGGGTIL